MIKLEELFGNPQSGEVIPSENPVQDLWALIERLASPGFVRSQFTPDGDTGKWEEAVDYSSIRIRQAFELQGLGGNKQLIVYPLIQYYVFLNLLRGVTSLKAEKPLGKGHGLKFISNESLMKCGAKMVSGTFSEFLDSRKVDSRGAAVYSLEECLRYIPEFVGALADLPAKERGTAVVQVTARRDGEIHLEWLDYKVDHAQWVQDFPYLEKVCERTNDPSIYKAVGYEAKDGLVEVQDFCAKYLWSSLNLIRGDLVSRTYWAAPKAVEGILPLPRECYYYMASFILANVARYEPELFQGEAGPNTDIHWVLNRFLRTADRYLPNLLLSWVSGTNMYFISK